VVGGVAHHAGKVSAERSMQEQNQNQQIADLQAGQAAPPPPPPAAAAPAPAAPPVDNVAQLVQLKGLLDAGALTQAEFDAEKAKILANG
jgi:Short C-terminal domain